MAGCQAFLGDHQGGSSGGAGVAAIGEGPTATGAAAGMAATGAGAGFAAAVAEGAAAAGAGAALLGLVAIGLDAPGEVGFAPAAGPAAVVTPAECAIGTANFRPG